MTNLGVRHESEGMGLGSRGYKELNLHLPGCARKGSGQRGRSCRERHTSATARGALGKGSLKLTAGFVL